MKCCSILTSLLKALPETWLWKTRKIFLSWSNLKNPPQVYLTEAKGIFVHMELLSLERFGETKARTLIYLLISLVKPVPSMVQVMGAVISWSPGEHSYTRKWWVTHNTLLMLVHKTTLSLYLRKPNHKGPMNMAKNTELGPWDKASLFSSYHDLEGESRGGCICKSTQVSLTDSICRKESKALVAGEAGEISKEEKSLETKEKGKWPKGK